MRVFLYSCQIALKNIVSEKWINFLTILSISVGLLLLTSYLTITLNIDTVIKRWGTGFGMVVYLDDGLSLETKETIKELLKQDSDILELKYVSSDEALKELREVLGNRSSILESMEANPLPSSFELKLKREALDPIYIEQKAARIKEMTGIEDVQYGEKWLSSLNTISVVMQAIALILGVAIFIAIAFITYSTIKVLFYRRKEEIETLKLLGATRSFIKMPFLIEGFLIGGVSGIISALSLFALYRFTVLKFVQFLPSIRGLLVSLPVEAYIAIPFAGALMSLTGSFFATGRIRY
ncbi:MAG: permease-like cell division protein FtsX [Nitrospirota bacterium]